MPDIDTLKRLFISHSSTDKDFVDRLARDLRRQGVELWVYFEGLSPGTRDWEAAVRHAIDQSVALLLIASPASRQSPYVRSEVMLAEAKKLPIYAVWAAGEEWIDSVPMNLAYVQYQDLRGEKYGEGLKVLVRELDRGRMTLPSHFLYRGYYRRFDDLRKLRLEGREVACEYRDTSGTFYIGSKPLPNGYGVILSASRFDFMGTSESWDAITLKPSTFASTYQLINEIFLEYLRAMYPPLAYGERWFLKDDSDFFARLILPWQWITNKKPPGGWTSPMVEPPSAYGLVPGSTWTISAEGPKSPIVFAANDEEILRLMTTKVKFVLAAQRQGDLLEVEPDPAQVARFKFTHFLEAHRWLADMGLARKILAPKEPFSEGFSELLRFFA
jgi:hypothetical protein